ncbi:MAG TPA: hypothetical protein VEQ09_09850 [Aquabacterium sp.]|nr:hypothetical protein [Aquabacterium sp.]
MIGLVRGAQVLLVLALLAGCGSSPKTYPTNGPVVPPATFQLTPKISYSLEQLVVVGAGLWLINAVYEPLAPNWDITEAKVAEDVYVIDMKLKRFHTGGSGESMLLIKRRAEQLRRENGFASYRIVDYTEGIESSTPVAQRFAQGLVQLVKAAPR